jgi:hypothetical protein
MISSVGISTATSSPAVALAGPLVNAVLAGALLVARSPALAAGIALRRVAVRHCQPLRLRRLPSVFGAARERRLGDGLRCVQPAAAVAAGRQRSRGAALYAGAVFGSLRVLRALVADGALSCADARRWCLTAYWAGGLLLTAAAALNPDQTPGDPDFRRGDRLRRDGRTHLHSVAA